MKTALVAGATGLIGSQLLELLLGESRYSRVIAISRNPLEIVNPKFQNVVAGPDTLDQYRQQLRADDVFCCLGTTMPKAKTKEAFRLVDFDYPLALARLSKTLGARQFFLVSASGAKKSAMIFYNRVKGEIEEAISSVGFESYHIVRPSLLVGPRVEHRAGEKTIIRIFSVIGFLIPKRFKAIESIRVARAMLRLAILEEKGTFFHESDELQNF